MAELADAPDSKSGSFGSEGSTPSLGTTQVLDKKHFKETEKKFCQIPAKNIQEDRG